MTEKLTLDDVMQAELPAELRQHIIHVVVAETMNTVQFATAAVKNLMADTWTSSPDMIRDVRDFHLKFGHPVLTTPTFPAQNRIDFRIRFIEEEAVKELKEAVEARDMTLIADSIADAIYVLIGMAHEFGIPLDKVWNEVQRSNMTKVIVPGTMKIGKPEGWQPPDILSILRQVGYDQPHHTSQIDPEKFM